ncbi:MAG: stress-induced protein [Rhodoferax sp.]|nr:stress-induced protein [Rhodoferax sp.]
MATNQGNQDGNKRSGTSNRGFASMDPAKQREIASLGGRAAHASGNAHEFTSEEARAAGSKSHGGNRAKQGGRGNESGGNSGGDKG